MSGRRTRRSGRASVGRLAGAVRRVQGEVKWLRNQSLEYGSVRELLRICVAEIDEMFSFVPARVQNQYAQIAKGITEEGTTGIRPLLEEQWEENEDPRFTFSRNFLAGVQRSDDPAEMHMPKSTSRLCSTAFRIGSRRNSRRFSSSMTAQRTLRLKRPRRRNRQSPDPHCEFPGRLRTKAMAETNDWAKAMLSPRILI